MRGAEGDWAGAGGVGMSIFARWFCFDDLYPLFGYMAAFTALGTSLMLVAGFTFWAISGLFSGMDIRGVCADRETSLWNICSFHVVRFLSAAFLRAENDKRLRAWAVVWLLVYVSG